MKHVIFVLTLLLVGVLLVGTGSAVAAAKAKANSGKWEADQSFVRSSARVNMNAAIKKLLADDDPTPVDRRKINGGIPFQTFESLPAPVIKKGSTPFVAPLSGSYDVGVGKTFVKVSDAVDALNANGVSGAVTLVLNDLLYDEHPIVVGTIPGASATNNVTLTVKAGVAAVVRFTLYPDLPWGFVFANAHYFTIDGVASGGTSLKFMINETTTAFPLHPREATIALGNVTDHIAIKNMTITSAADNATWANVKDARHGIILLNTSLSTTITDVRIEGCKFGRCFYGVVSICPNDGDDGHIFAGGATSATIGQVQGKVQRIKILSNLFGPTLTGEQPCANAISVGGYSLEAITGGYDIEVAHNKAIGNVFNGDFDYVDGAGDLIGTYTGYFEPLYHGGLFGPTDFAVHGARNSLTDSSTVHDNVDSLYYLAKSLTHGTSTAFANLAYCFSVRGLGSSSYGQVTTTMYNNLATRAYDNDAGRQTYLSRIEGCRVYHNTFWATGPGRRFFAARPRSGCTYWNNIFYAAKNGNTVNRVCALRYDGGSGKHNVIAKDPAVADGSTGTVLWRDGAGNLYWQLSDLQAIYSTDLTSTRANPNITDPGNMSPSGTSSAESFGAPIPGFGFKDVLGTSRSVTTPDAGAYEFSGTAASLTDAAALTFVAPPAAGTPIASPVTPKVRVSNLSYTSQSITTTLTIADGSGYSSPVVATIPALSESTLSFTSWTPPGNGPYTLTATTTLAGDANAANDVITRAQAIVPLLSTFPQNFDFEGGDNQGWVGTGSWILNDNDEDFGSGNLTALGGAHGGQFAWVTDDLTGAGTYATATNHQLLSPFFNTNGVDSLFVNFFHSIKTEPTWDRSVFQYSLDSGKNWVVIGGLNDPKGINWYSENPYENANKLSTACFDDATAKTQKWPDTSGTNVPAWTSNGDCGGDDAATGPFGYIFVQIKLPNEVIHKPFVRFRYAAFSDAGTTEEGCAVDDIQFSTTPNSSVGSFSGEVYGDGNGNGVQDPWESGIDGIKVYVKGAKNDSTVTAGGGLYTFGGLIAGAYSFSVAHSTGTSVTQPYGPNTYTQLFGPGDVYSDNDFGLFTGGVSGDPYADHNANGVKDPGDGGVKGWEIRAYKMTDLYAFKQAVAKGDDAALDELKVASTTSDASGNYFIEAKAGDYIIAEVLDPKWKNTEPGVADTTLVDNGDGTSTTHDVYGFYTDVHIDSTTPAVTGGRFGNFEYGVLRVYNVLDVNGNGVHDPVENLAMPLGVNATFNVTKNGAPFKTITVGNNVDAQDLDGLEVGSYTVQFASTNAGWYQTVAGGHTTPVFSSGVKDTAYFGAFQGVVVDGHVYDDTKGDSSASADPGASGWTVNMTGPGGPYTTTTGVGGVFEFTGIGPGSYTVTQVLPAGWMRTAPSTGSYTVNAAITGQAKRNNNFWNFKLVTIGGTKYRDRNMNGVQDAGDEGLSGWQLNLTGQSPQTSDANGHFSWTVGPGIYSLSETPQVGWALVTPPGGVYVDTVLSGVNLTQNFGNFYVGDSVMYRTWTYDELAADAGVKAVKKPKVGTAPTAAPNAQNMLNDILDPAGKGGSITVGIGGQTLGGKEKGWVSAAKGKDVFKTLSDKGTKHVGNPHPLSFDNSGLKRILKKNKSLSALKYNNILLADLLTLKVNLAASALHQTNIVSYLGDLQYCESSNPVGAARTAVADIANKVDSIMTNWDVLGYPGFEAPVFVMYDSIVAKINAVFSTGSTTDTAVYGGWSAAKLRWALKATAQSTSFLCAPDIGAATHQGPLVGTREPLVVPEHYALLQNYPNPFNPTTTLSFDLPSSAVVTLKIYNMLGQEVATILDNESFDAGNQEVDFDATGLTSGVYFYRVAAKSMDDDGIFTGDSFSQVKKMMLVK